MQIFPGFCIDHVLHQLAGDERKRGGHLVRKDRLVGVDLEGHRVTRVDQRFATAAGLTCRNCHRVGAIGKALGPDLTAIGKDRSRVQLLESILYPSKRIEPKFLTYLVETVDGKVMSGLLVSRDEKQLVLRDAAGKQTTIAQEDIEFSAPQQKSLMPELLLRESTAQEVADLLEYLASQRGN